MFKTIFNLTVFLFSSLVVCSQHLYLKPQLNFEFGLTNTIRQDYLPYNKINNNHLQAVILPGLRLEYIKSNGNGYFLNIGVLPLGYSVKYTDYATIDPFYRQRATSSFYTGGYSKSASSDITIFDIGFINRLAKLNITKKKALDIKFAYGATVASIRPYSDSGNFRGTNINSMGKKWEIRESKFPYFNIDKGKLAFMIPLKLNLNLRSKIKNKELISFDISYWQSLARGGSFNLAYHNLTDNIVYDNVVESKGSTWQLGIQIPIRIKLKSKISSR
ncbi:MAG: hypothetical protein WKF85_07795 [Chitinophagaceae bacterium]